jgi:hypothetical protein
MIRHPRCRAALPCVLRTSAALTMLLLSQAAEAQRPAPPKNWVIDTTSGTVSGLRRGGLLSSDTRVELLGPVEWQSPALGGWLQSFARANIATLGSVNEAAKDTVGTSAVSQQQVLTAAYSVTTPAGNRYVSYSVLQSAAANAAPVIVIRATFGDALTFVRTFRSALEAMMPFVLTPMASMRATRPVALAAIPPTSFRARALPQSPPPSVTDSGRSGDGGAVALAVRAGFDEAITLLVAPAPRAGGRPSRPDRSSRAGSRRSTPEDGNIRGAVRR